MEPDNWLLFNLETISCINIGDRISTHNTCINIQKESPLLPVWRTIYHESRTKAIDLIKNICDLAILIADLMMDSHEIKGEKSAVMITKLSNMRILFDKSITGINNLCFTYNEDTNTISKLTPVSENMSNCARRMARFLSKEAPLRSIEKV